MQHPDRFYPVVDSIAWLKRLTALGVGTVQLRVKDLDHDDAVEVMREALAVTHGTGTQLVVNDYWQAAHRGRRKARASRPGGSRGRRREGDLSRQHHARHSRPTTSTNSRPR